MAMLINLISTIQGATSTKRDFSLESFEVLESQILTWKDSEEMS